METKTSVEFGTDEWIREQALSICSGGDYSKISSKIFKTIREQLGKAMFNSLKDVNDFEDKQWGKDFQKKMNIQDILEEIGKTLIFSISIEDVKMKLTEKFLFYELYECGDMFQSYNISEKFIQGLMIMLSFKPVIAENGEISFLLPEYIKEIFELYNDEIRLMEVCYFMDEFA